MLVTSIIIAAAVGRWKAQKQLLFSHQFIIGSFIGLLIYLGYTAVAETMFHSAYSSGIYILLVVVLGLIPYHISHAWNAHRLKKASLEDDFAPNRHSTS